MLGTMLCQHLDLGLMGFIQGWRAKSLPGELPLMVLSTVASGSESTSASAPGRKVKTIWCFPRLSSAGLPSGDLLSRWPPFWWLPPSGDLLSGGLLSGGLLSSGLLSAGLPSGGLPSAGSRHQTSVFASPSMVTTLTFHSEMTE